MLRNSSSIDPDHNTYSTPVEAAQTGSSGVDIERELNQLEEIILAGSRIPLTGRILVDEDKLLDQLDLLRLNLPGALEQAKEIVQQQEEIVLQAEQHAKEIIEAAQARAAQILNETEIIQQAELAAKQLEQQVQQECNAALEHTMAEIDRMQRQVQQELEEMRAGTIAECTEIQQGADEYADHTLKNIEQKLNDMLRVIHNGRQQLRE